MKAVLEIDPDNKAEDKKLLLINEWVSGWFEEFWNRPGMSYKQRTEYYGGTSTQKLLLKSRPVFASPVPQVYLDEGGFFGSVSGSFDANTSQLVYGRDFCLKLDTSINDSGTQDVSRCGILVRINNLWPRPAVRQAGLLSPFIGESFGSIKVVYWAGHTVDTLPNPIRMAANLLVARLRMILPLGAELNSESYIDRNISIVTSEKDKLMAMVKPILLSYRNWVFG